MLSLEFMFRSKTYYALVRTKLNDNEKYHYVTVMNGDLERLLYGYHIIIEKEDGEFCPASEVPGVEIADLQACVLHALKQKMQQEYPEKNYEHSLYAV